MSVVTKEVGKKIHTYRKINKMTLDDLANIICKSKATVSKYERGEIALDIETLYELAQALHIDVSQLLYEMPSEAVHEVEKNIPSFFKDLSHFYGYIYDGRDKQIIKCLFELFQPGEEVQKIRMYMNFKSYEFYQDCENLYDGYIEHYDAVTNIILRNNHMPMERASIQMLASSLYASQRWGLWNGLSTRPLMPIATKILMSTTKVDDEDEVMSQLRISNNDIKLFKLYNMFPVF